MCKEPGEKFLIVVPRVWITCFANTLRKETTVFAFGGVDRGELESGVSCAESRGAYSSDHWSSSVQDLARPWFTGAPTQKNVTFRSAYSTLCDPAFSRYGSPVTGLTGMPSGK